MDNEEVQIIKRYFDLGFSYSEIVAFLYLNHNRKISYRQLQRILKANGLRRRNVHSNLDAVIQAVMCEIEGSGSNCGYRSMHHRLGQKYHLTTSRESVRVILSNLQPEAVGLRRQRKLHRRQYNVKGPNQLWHIDGWDKLKPFGLCVHGCIDGFSRKLLWLEATPTNKDPFVICRIFADTVRRINGIPCTVRADRGTENVNIEAMQMALSNINNPYSLNTFLYGKSTSNQRIESFWGKFRIYGMDVWIEHFKSLSNAGVIDTSLELHMECIKFCFMPLLRSELQDILEQWNSHYVRKSRDYGPFGRPDTMFFLPEHYGARNCLKPLHIAELENLQDSLTTKIADCKEVYMDLFTVLVTENELSAPKTLYEADDLLVFLLDNIEDKTES